VLDGVPGGGEVASTAGSRGIHDATAVLPAAIADPNDRGYEPVVLAATGSHGHGGATAEEQRETLAALGITEERLSREIRSSMAVERVGTDGDDRPVYVAADALAVDAVVLVNRVKAHTDLGGPIESGLCEMAAIGLGQTRGAKAAHSAALASSFREVLPDRLSVLLDTVPIAGGIALVENADERLADLRGLAAGAIPEREPAVLERAEGLVGTLPVDPFDLLVLEAIGEDVSGTGMNTSVVGRMPLRGEPDVESPDGARIHIRASCRPATATRPAWEIAD
jgi:hypothetical protein